MSRRLGLVLLVVLLAVGGWYGWRTFFGGAAGAGGPGMGPMPVSVAPALSMSFRQTRQYGGQLTAVASVEVRPQVGGTIQQVHFTEGSLVKAGEPLFTLDLRPFRYAVTQADAQARLAEMNLARFTRLQAVNASSKQQLDEAAATAAVTRAAAQRARLDLDYAVVKAPVSGRVGRPEITVGNVVEAGPGAPALTSIQTRDPIYADFEIGEQDYLDLLSSTGGQPLTAAELPVHLALADGQGFARSGRLVSLDNRLQPGAGTLRLRAVFENPDDTLIPGLTARVRLGYPAETQVVAIPEQAISTDQSKRNVFVMGPNNIPVYREVTPGAHLEGDDRNLRVITHGLKAGEQVVVVGTQRIFPGAPVVPQPVDPRTLQPVSGTAPAAAPVSGTEAQQAPQQ